MRKICIQKIIQEEFCTLKHKTLKIFQLAYLQVTMLSDHTVFCKAQNSPLSEGFSMISLDKKI